MVLARPLPYGGRAGENPAFLIGPEAGGPTLGSLTKPGEILTCRRYPRSFELA